MSETRHHISSAVIITRPERVDDLWQRLNTLEGVEPHAKGAGKIVIVIEGPTASYLGEALIRISAMDDVIAAHMVFEQAIIEGEETSDDVRTHAA